MNKGQAGLRSVVDDVWTGQSAQIFKENMETDKKLVTEALRATFEALKTDLFEIVNKYENADQTAVARREG